LSQWCLSTLETLTEMIIKKGRMNEKIIKCTITTLILFLVVSIVGNVIAWNKRSSIGDIIDATQNELHVAIKRNRDLATELQSSKDRIDKLTSLIGATQAELDTARRELEKSIGYYANLERQVSVSGESIIRIGNLINEGEQIIRESENYLQEGDS